MLASSETSCTSGALAPLARKGRKWDFTTGRCGDPTAPSARSASAAPVQIRTVDASSQPWRVAVNKKSSDHSEVIFWIVDPLVGQPVLGALAANFGVVELRRHIQARFQLAG